MPTLDKVKNLMFVKQSQAKKKEEIGVQEFNRIHSQEQSKYRDNLRQKQGEEEYKKKNAEYMKKYRLAKKALKQKQQPDIRTPSANVLQNAFRNKMARNAMLKAKQDKANEVISQINQQRQLKDTNELKSKLLATVMTNDILNTVFPSVINTNYPILPVGRPPLSMEEKARRELQKQQRPKKKAGRPPKYV